MDPEFPPILVVDFGIGAAHATTLGEFLRDNADSADVCAAVAGLGFGQETRIDCDNR